MNPVYEFPIPSIRYRQVRSYGSGAGNQAMYSDTVPTGRLWLLTAGHMFTGGTTINFGYIAAGGPGAQVLLAYSPMLSNTAPGGGVVHDGPYLVLKKPHLLRPGDSVTAFRQAADVGTSATLVIEFYELPLPPPDASA